MAEAQDMMEPINVLGIDEGKLLRAIDNELSKIGKDVVRRQEKPEVRKVTMEVALKPTWSKDLDCYIVEVGWTVKSKVPGEGGVTSIATIENDIVVVNPNDASDPRQTTIEDHEADDPEDAENSAEDSAEPEEPEGPWDTPMRKVPAPEPGQNVGDLTPTEPVNASAQGA